MCFSPEADLVGGAVVGAIGVYTIRAARHRHRHVALAALPLVLGFHQVVEAFVWFGLEGDVPHGIERFALWLYLLIAFVFLPLFVPFAVRRNEPDRRRRQLMAPLVVLGAAVAADLLAAMLRGPVSVRLRPYHLAYSIKLADGGVIVGLYVLVVCGTLLLSSRRRVVIFGAVNLVAVAVIAWLTIEGFASVWCGWAAVSSAAVALHVRIGRTQHGAAALGGAH